MVQLLLHQVILLNLLHALSGQVGLSFLLVLTSTLKLAVTSSQWAWDSRWDLRERKCQREGELFDFIILKSQKEVINIICILTYLILPTAGSVVQLLVWETKQHLDGQILSGDPLRFPSYFSVLIFYSDHVQEKQSSLNFRPFFIFIFIFYFLNHAIVSLFEWIW